MERVEDHVLAFVGAWVAGDDIGGAANHHSVDVTAAGSMANKVCGRSA